MFGSQEKKFDYFKAFMDMADCACKAADLLIEVLNNYNLAENFEDRRSQMADIEHASDEVMYEVMHHVARDFITPIEREDIVHIAQAMDDVTDMIDDIFLAMYVYQIQTLRPQTLELTECIGEIARALAVATEEFSYFKKSKFIKERIIQISNIEKKADQYHIQALYNLFADQDVPCRDIIIWKDIFKRLEACCDAAERVANGMETVLLKNS